MPEETPDAGGKSAAAATQQREDITQTVNPSETVAKIADKPSRKKAGKKRRGRKGKSSGNSAQQVRRGRGGVPRTFPGSTFESVLPLSRVIFENAGAAKEMRRETVFEKLGKAANSGTSRVLVINSGRYGLTTGGYVAEVLKLTDDAVLVLDQNTPAALAVRAKYRLAIGGIPPFEKLYETYKGGKLPAPEVLRDALTDVAAEDRQDCVDIFIGNLKYIGLLKVVSGAEWILDVDQTLEPLRPTSETIPTNGNPASNHGGETVDFDSICFFVSPIGEEGDEQRKHSDMVLETLLETALAPFKLKVVRADKITQPGMISKQIIEHILKSKLVIADMSFHNPSAFYELAIRHLLGKPTVHLIRKRDELPFDVNNFRTIMIDDEDKYDLIAKLDTYRADIANYVREALEGSSSADNPILAFFPDIKVSLN